MFQDILVFFLAILDRWQSYVTGGALTASVVTIELLTRWKVPRWTYATIFLVFLALSVFLAWRDQYQTARQTALMVSALQQQAKELDKTIEDVRRSMPQTNASAVVVKIPRLTPVAKTPVADVCASPSTCPLPELKKSTLALADKIDLLYWENEASNRRIESESRADPAVADSPYVAGERYSLQIKLDAERTLYEYGRFYQTDAIRYRDALIIREGPGAHDREIDYKYSALLPRDTSQLHVVAGDLRRLAANL